MYVPNESRSIFKKDFDGTVDVVPVSDPNIPSNAHRMMLANMALQMAQQSPPGMFNLEALNRTILNAANMPNLEEILPEEPKPQPMDPVSDIMGATKGLPIAAFPGQNHDAHIQVKMAYLQDPTNGANPIMQRLRPVLEANVQEHSIMKYQEQMSGVTGVMVEQLPPEQRTPSGIEAVMAAAAKEVLNANQQMGRAQSPEQQMVALEQSRVEVEREKLKLDVVTENAEMALKTQELELKRQQQMIDAQTAGINISARVKKSDEDRSSREALKQMDVMAKMAIEEERIQLEQQKLLSQSAVSQATIELKGQTANIKGLQDIDKTEKQEEKDKAQLALQLMQEMGNITNNEEK